MKTKPIYFAAFLTALFGTAGGLYLGTSFRAAPATSLSNAVPSSFSSPTTAEKDESSSILHLPALLPAPAHLPPLVTSAAPMHYRIVTLPRKFLANALNDKTEIAGTWINGEGRAIPSEPATYCQVAVWKNSTVTCYPASEEQPECSAHAISETSKIGCVGNHRARPAQRKWTLVSAHAALREKHGKKLLYCAVALCVCFGIASRLYLQAAFCSAPPRQKSSLFPSTVTKASNKFGLYFPLLPPLLPKPAHLPPLITSGTFKSYRLVPLPEELRANALNDKGEIAGTWIDDAKKAGSGFRYYRQAAVWKNNTVTRCPNSETQPDCSANAISETSEVGCSGGDTFTEPMIHGRYSVFVWSFAAQPSSTTEYKIQNAGHLPDRSGVNVQGINNHDQMVGWCFPWDVGEGSIGEDFKDIVGEELSGASGFYWDGRRLIGLGDAAYGINERNQVVGVQEGNITLWQHDARTFLGKGRAYSINNRGWVVGEKDVSGTKPLLWNDVPVRRAFVWRGSGAPKDLACLFGDTVGKARWINDRGQIVGFSLCVLGKYAGRKRAVLWQSGKAIDLNSFAPRGFKWNITDALAINNKSQILVRGQIGGDERSFLLTPR